MTHEDQRQDSTKRVTRRDLFDELTEGMTALAEARLGKRTLCTHAIFDIIRDLVVSPPLVILRLPER